MTSPGKIALAAAVVAVGLISAGCAAVGPDYQAPSPQTPPAWRATMTGGLEAATPQAQALAQWWARFDDPLLTELIGQSLAGNLDIKTARAKVRQARAARGLSQAALWPELSADGAFESRRASENSRSGSGGQYDLYSGGFDAGWEIDIFGGARRGVEAAQADLEAAQADLRDVWVSICAETARNYVEARTYQARLAAMRANLEAQTKTHALIAARRAAGLSNELALRQAGYNLESSRAQLPGLQAGLESSLNSLAILAGRTPGSLHQRLAEVRPIPQCPPRVAVGVPAEALRQRPDIRAAERRLAAQTARVGVATAALYPKLRLLGSIGLESVSSGELFSAASQAWGIGPAVSWKIFDAGAVRQNIAIQSSLQEQALLAYQKAVLAALAEVEDNLTAYAREQLRAQSLAKAVEEARRAEAIAQDQYRAGLVDFNNVLEAQRSLLQLQDQLAQSRGAVTSDLITVYKALGGGWNALAEDQRTTAKNPRR
ncbi:RND efflux system, outer membrane lipoprotein, NodT family [Desulfarculus baarsii DSM 2075]|uniref:RND efflux system, outer membrane lipoprotein, NodT family n=1 Tax=Desulfarculus baarsii (strain ATCC 33931 / DSM 2075 / LMG 7858 / VKM B-1802 / 2st14) TaxID=644282 RepID=E1QD80_DESB2|nr:efflux transporter outer membrane subunit [Desulfarculus baarsii]ADK83399.1 RND efflux system, outer membrane lipoprotein, NodT family [Desulfarculus baarsii DSM 2075]